MKNTSGFLFFLVSFFLTISCPPLLAQGEYLMLEKAYSDRRIIYKSGDKISFRLIGEKHYRTDHIVSLDDTSIQFHYNNIPYRDISHINTKGRSFSGFNARTLATYAQVIGPAYIAIDQFNQVVVRGEEASFNEGVWVAGGLIFLGGTLIKIANPLKKRLGEKYRLKYINVRHNIYDY